LFIEKPSGRTADVVPSINVLVAQLIALREIAPMHQVVKNNDP
jgi:hypothetical protein